MCPLALELKKHKAFECIVCLTGQHREMLRQVMEAFNVQEDYNLDIMRDRQTLTAITMEILEKLEPVLKNANLILFWYMAIPQPPLLQHWLHFISRFRSGMSRRGCELETNILPFLKR